MTARKRLNPFISSLIFAAACGVIYGVATQLVARNMFKGPKENMTSWLVMSAAYVFLLPFVIGMVHVFFRSRQQLPSYAAAIFEPLLPSFMCLVLSFIVNWEGTICLIMALPIMLVLAALGGLAMRIILNFRQKNLIFAFFVFLPIPLSLIEHQAPLPQEKQIVSNTVRINASADIVWKKIVRVEKITEKQESLFFAMGFPRPIEAVLTGDGVGQTRLATFEHGLQFVETVTDWQQNKKLGFTIKADPKMTPLTTLDEHVTVGGEFFDVLSGVYEIHPAGPDQVDLRLYSQHRISTHYNFYARQWSKFLMSEIQGNILTVVKARAEAEMRSLK
jgi:hypothetical protein